MGGMKISSAEFVKSAVDPSGYPADGLAEVAFAGRSNVGKSTLINCLLERKNLAHTSSKPGRTRTINFYRVNNLYMFADLPGYGWARVSKNERQSWKQMVEGYLKGRKELRAVVMIVDLRRGVETEEQELFAWLEHKAIPAIIVGTKADKLKFNARKTATRSLAHALVISEDDVLIFSGRTKQGRDALWGKLLESLNASR
jgi:GTP-binding protein